MGVDPYAEFSFSGTYPVVQSDMVVLPSVTLPLKVESPASLRALEESLKTDGIIFLTDGRLKVGTLCRASRKLMRGVGGDALGFIGEGLERGVALSVKETEGFRSAEVSSDPTPDEVPDEERLKELDKEVRWLVGKLHSLLPEEEIYDPFSPSGGLAGSFNIQDITSPSRLADHTAFLLYMRELISTEQLRAILETFRPDHRLENLFQILTEELETRQLQALLLRRMERRHPTRPLLPQKFLDKFERNSLHHLREFHPNLTALSRRQYVSIFLLEAVDEAVESLFADASVKVEQDRREIHNVGVTPAQSRRELKKRAIEAGRRHTAYVSRRLGRSEGRTKKWGRLELARAIDRAMDEVLSLSKIIGIDYTTVADKLNELYPNKGRLTANALKRQVGSHRINWMKRKSSAQYNYELRELIRSTGKWDSPDD